MSEKHRVMLVSVLLNISAVSAQITGGYGSASIIDVITRVIGINVGRPYELIGFLSTLAVLMVTTYIVLRSALGFIDESLGDEYDDYFLEAAGVSNEDDTNILALASVLVVLTMVGTFGFMDIIDGFQSLIILAFLFTLLAGITLVISSGTGAIIGGTALGIGLGTRATATGIDEVRNALDEVERREDRADPDRSDPDREDAELSAEELEEIIEIIDEVEEEIDGILEDEEESLEEDIERLRELLELLGETGD